MHCISHGRKFRLSVALVLACSGAFALGNVVKTEDGLFLKLSPDGFIERVVIDDYWFQLNRFDGGLHIRDAHNPGVPYELEVVKDEVNPLAYHLKIADLLVEATVRYTVAPKFITVDIEVRDLSKHPRALEVLYSLPVGRKGWAWWGEARESQKIEPDRNYQAFSVPSRIGKRGRLSAYPLCSLSGPKGQGLAIAVPPTHPRCHLFQYASGQLVTTFYLALSPEAGQSKGRRSVRLVMYRHDAAWGFRDAVRRYAELFPDYFQPRAEAKGAALFDLAPSSLDAGEGEGAEEERPSSHHSIYSIPMPQEGEGPPARGAGDPSPYLAISPIARLRYFSVYPQSPGYAESVLRLSSDPVIQAEIQPYWGPRSSLPKIMKNSLVRMPNRWPALAGFQADLEDKDSIAPRELNYLVNLDPDLFAAQKEELDFTAGQQVLLAIQKAFEAAPDLAGICLHDAVPGAKALNYNRDHYGYSDFPLAYDGKLLRPALLNQFSLVEFLDSLRRRTLSDGGPLHGKHIWLHGKRLDQIPAGPLVFLSDLISFEVKPELKPKDDGAIYDCLRTLAFRKPLFAIAGEEAVAAAISRKDFGPWMTGLLQWHTFYGIPLSPARMWLNESLRPKLKAIAPDIRRHLKIATDLQSAGWRPVTHATTDSPAVWVERYGEFESPALYFAAYNSSEEEKSVRIRLSRKELGLTSQPIASVTELQSGAAMRVVDTAELLVIKAQLKPGQCTVLQVKK